MLVKFWYVHGTGKKRERTQLEEKELEGVAAIKNRKVLEGVGTFSTAMGSGGYEEPKPECPELTALHTLVEQLRPF